MTICLEKMSLRPIVIKFYIMLITIEINECTESTHRCEQICRNKMGSYNCSCNVGYTLANDRHGCTSKTTPIGISTIIYYFTMQTLMNVHWILMPAPRSALIPLVPITVVVIQGTFSTLMDIPAMVLLLLCTKMN